MKISDQIESNTAGQGLKSQATTGKTAPVVDGQEFALTFASEKEANLAAQLKAKTNDLVGITGMIDSAVDAIAQVEEDILSGNYLERKLAQRRSQYAFGCVQDVAVSTEFEALTTLEAMAKPAEFPSIESTIKALKPADRKQLDQAVLGPAK